MCQKTIRKRTSLSRQRARQRGFSLLEVLVAFTILAVGLLGVAALQLTGSQYNHDAYLRSQFSVLIYDMVDRIRLNKANAASYVTTLGTTGSPSCDVAVVSAANDLDCWHARFIDVAPAGTTAAIANPGANEYTIRVAYTDRESNNKVLFYRFEP